MNKNIKLDYGCGLVEYINVKRYKITSNSICIDRFDIDTKDVKYILIDNRLIWKNIKK